MFYPFQHQLISNCILCNFYWSLLFFFFKTGRPMLLENWLQRSRCWNVTWHFDIIWKASEVQVFQEVSWHSFLQDHVQSHLPLSALTRPICQMLRANCVVCGAGSFQAHSTGRTETMCAKKQNPLLIFVKHMMVFFDFAVGYTSGNVFSLWPFPCIKSADTNW